MVRGNPAWFRGRRQSSGIRNLPRPLFRRSVGRPVRIDVRIFPDPDLLSLRLRPALHRDDTCAEPVHQFYARHRLAGTRRRRCHGNDPDGGLPAPALNCSLFVLVRAFPEKPQLIFYAQSNLSPQILQALVPMTA